MENYHRYVPLYFKGNEPGASVAMLAWNEGMWEPANLQCHLQYSTDGMATWGAWDGSIVYLDDCTDSKVYFRADPANPNTKGFCVNYICHYFKTDKSVAAGGNIQFLLESTGTRTDVPENGFYQLFSGVSGSCASLTQAPLLPATTLGERCYINMFMNCTSLVQAPALPATTLGERCYLNMFMNCTSLTQAPALPATILANSCYENMFFNCTSLVQAPALPATTLASGCYGSMFYECTSLVQAPALPATTLANGCYSYMFDGCTSLVQAPALPATTLALECYDSMFGNCTSLVQAPALPSTELIYGCYSYMFDGCTSLVQAPALPATTLADACYSGMFNGCTHLNSMDVSFTAWNPSNATYAWVASAGSEASGEKMFTCPSGLPQTFGNSNIPSGWTVVTK